MHRARCASRVALRRYHRGPIAAARHSSYPAQYVSKATLRDGTEIVIRPIRPEDEPALVAFHESLSETSVRFRYFGFVSLSQRTAHERLTRACFNDYDREIALVAEHRRASGPNELLGIVRLIKAHGLNEAEFAIVVADAWQKRSLGTALMRQLLEVAQRENIERVVGHILPDNTAMLALTRTLGFVLSNNDETGEWRAEIHPSRSAP